MHIKALIFLFIVINANGQQFSDSYNKLAIEAESYLSQKNYSLAASRYSDAFMESNGRGMRMDLYNAAKAWSLYRNKDSAYYYLMRLANSKSYYSLENAETDSEFEYLRNDKRWEVLKGLIAANKQLMTKAIPLNYKQFIIAGNEVLIDTVLIKNFSSVKDSVVELLTADLKAVYALPLDRKITDFFKTVRFFVDAGEKNSAAQYHARENEDWLLQNGSLVEKAGCVDISNARNYLVWRNQNQPFMILHELAHAYHDKVLGFKFKSILSAYEHAKTANLYLNISYHFYGTVYTTQPKAYALGNEKEYFAELTEAFLGRNDFYPFIRKELAEYDIDGYDVVKKIWE